MKKQLLTLFLACTALFSAAAQEVDANLVDAVQLYADGQVGRAREMLKILSAADPGNDAVWYYRALTETVSNELDQAQASLEKAVALDSTNYWYRRMLARLCLMQGKEEEGKAQYESLVKSFPEKTTLVYELLEVYLGARDYEKALSTLQEIENQRGLSEEVARTRYDVYTAMGRQEEGAATLEQFNRQYSSPAILSMLGDYYLADYADSLAQARYSEALSLDSRYVPAILGISEVYRHMRRYPDYFSTLEPFFTAEDIPVATKTLYIGNMGRSLDPKILQLHREGFDKMVLQAATAHPADSSMLSTVGTYYYSTGREKEAGEWFRRAADLYPESLPLAATYVQYLSLQEQWEPLRERSTEAYSRFGELAFLDYANMANYQLEDYDAIIGHCRFLLEHFPQDRQVCLGAWSMMGDACHAKGDSRQAYKAYEKALKLDPSYAPVLNNYAYYLSMEGKKLKKAYKMSRKTIEAEPDNSTYLDTFGWILHLMGKDLEAKPFFKHAMLYGGKESVVVLEHYATVLEALGEADTATVYRNQAARLQAQGKQ